MGIVDDLGGKLQWNPNNVEDLVLNNYRLKHIIFTTTRNENNDGELLAERWYTELMVGSYSFPAADADRRWSSLLLLRDDVTSLSLS